MSDRFYALLRLISLYLLIVTTTAMIPSPLPTNRRSQNKDNLLDYQDSLEPTTQKHINEPHELNLPLSERENPAHLKNSPIELTRNNADSETEKQQLHIILLQLIQKILIELDQPSAGDTPEKILLKYILLKQQVINAFLNQPEAYQLKHLSSLIKAGYLENTLINFQDYDQTLKSITVFEFYLKSSNIKMACLMLQLGQKPEINHFTSIRIREYYGNNLYYDIETPLIYLPLSRKEFYKVEGSMALVSSYLQLLSDNGYVLDHKNIIITHSGGSTVHKSIVDVFAEHFHIDKMHPPTDPSLAAKTNTENQQLNTSGNYLEWFSIYSLSALALWRGAKYLITALSAEAQLKKHLAEAKLHLENPKHHTKHTNKCILQSIAPCIELTLIHLSFLKESNEPIEQYEEITKSIFSLLTKEQINQVTKHYKEIVTGKAPKPLYLLTIPRKNLLEGFCALNTLVKNILAANQHRHEAPIAKPKHHKVNKNTSPKLAPSLSTPPSSPTILSIALLKLSERIKSCRTQHTESQKQIEAFFIRFDRLQTELNRIQTNAAKNDTIRTLLSEKTKTLKQILKEANDFIKDSKDKMIKIVHQSQAFILNAESKIAQLNTLDLKQITPEQYQLYETLDLQLRQYEKDNDQFIQTTSLITKDTNDLSNKIHSLHERIKRYDSNNEYQEKMREEAERAQQAQEAEALAVQQAMQAEAERVAQLEREQAAQREREQAEQRERDRVAAEIARNDALQILPKKRQETKESFSLSTRALVQRGFIDKTKPKNILRKTQTHQWNTVILGDILSRINTNKYPYTNPENAALVGRLALLCNLIHLFEFSKQDMGEINHKFLNKIRNIIMHQHNQLDYELVSSFATEITERLYPLLKTISGNSQKPIGIENDLRFIFKKLNTHPFANINNTQRSLATNLQIIEQSLSDLRRLPIKVEMLMADIPNEDLWDAELFLITTIGEAMQQIHILAKPLANPGLNTPDEVKTLTIEMQKSKKALIRLRKHPMLNAFLDLCYDARKNIAHHMTPEDDSPIFSIHEPIPTELLKQYFLQAEELQESFLRLAKEPKPRQRSLVNRP